MSHFGPILPFNNLFGPVLLLDDVLSELDPRRQEFVLNRIPTGQVFITCCEVEKGELLHQGRVFHIAQGALQEG